MKKDVTCVYIIKQAIDDRVYIGSALNFRTRCNRHLSALVNNKHYNKKLQNFFNKYGELEMLILEECNKDILYEREQYYIDHYDSFKSGFNMSPSAGNTIGFKMSKESIDKSRESRKGYKHSDETKEKIRLSSLAFKHTEESKGKISTANKGKKRSEQFSIDLGNRVRGRKATDETKRKISIAHKAIQIKPQSLSNLVPYCKLTIDNVIQIKQQICKGDTDANIAKEFNVDKKSINNIRNNKTWAKVI